MNRSRIFKALALLNFVALIALFLLYRNGSFDSYIYGNDEKRISSPHGGTPLQTTKDSTKTENDSLERLRLSSSKSTIIIEHIEPKEPNIYYEGNKFILLPKQDSIKLTQKRLLMPSSKSMIITEPVQFTFDTTNNKSKKL